MSHLNEIDLQIQSEDALARAVVELGGRFVRNCQTFNSYNPHQPCLHKITVPGVNYEIGVRKTDDGIFTLHADFYSYMAHDGHKLKEKFGDNLSKLRQPYAIHAAMLKAKSSGYMTTRRTLKNGDMQLVITV